MEHGHWIDSLLEEMEAAWIAADEAGLRPERREAAVKSIIRKYFCVGMPKSDAYRLLRQLKNHGFEIAECRHEGVRAWPDGELTPYPDEQTRSRLQRQILSGFGRITAVKPYQTSRSPFVKGSGITMMVGDRMEGVVSVRGVIWLNTAATVEDCAQNLDDRDCTRSLDDVN